MRGSLGATRRERVLAENPWRQVVLVRHGSGLRVVRRIRADASEGTDLVDRAGALGLVRHVRIPGFAYVEDRAIVGGTLEIAESYVDGVKLGAYLDVVREAISVGVAIAIVHDIALGLSVIHAMIEPSGRPATLIHGRIDVDQMIVMPSGDVRVVGLEGLRGSATQDVHDLLAVLHSLLVAKASSKAGSALLERLSQLKFESAKQMVAALTAYLDRQREGEIAQKRAAFAEQVVAAVPDHGPPAITDTGAPAAPDEPLEVDTDATARAKERDKGRQSLGVSAAIEMDEDGDGPTITDAIPDTLADDSSVLAADTIDTVDSAARQGILAASAPQKVEHKIGPEKSITVGNYRVVASIGRGGMGEIYLAKSMSEHYRGLVALKVLGVDDSHDDEALGMFIDEASIMARIDHPNVLKVVDFGRAKGRHFLAMEYLEGRPLVRVMIDGYAKETGLDYGTIAAIGADSARGLFAAHTATSQTGAPLKVVHRDISPQNIFVTYAGVTKVIDFGVARASQRVSKTAVGVVKGKAAYMSPEQTEGKEVDARSDVFSLGICLWEMTAGRRLFKRETEYDTLMAVSTAPIDRPTQVRGKPNPVLDRVILNALTRNREKRTASALELAAQLTEYIQGVGLKDPRASVRDLMERLFGAVAAEEKALIRGFEARAATEAEEDSLRRLSGVAQRKGMRPEITLVGAPSALLELERFGESPGPKPSSGGKNPIIPPPPSTGEVVLRAVEAIKAQAVSGLPKPAPATTDSEPATSPFDSSFEIVSVPPPLMSRDYPQVAGASMPIDVDSGDFEPISSRVSGVTEAPVAAASDDSHSTYEPLADLISDAESSTTAKRPAAVVPVATTRRVAIWVAAAGIVMMMATIAFLMRSWRTTDNAPPKIDREQPVQQPPLPLKEAVILPPVHVPEPKIHTSTASVEMMLDEVQGSGIAVAASETSLLISDRFKGSAVIGSDASVTRVEGAKIEGFIVETVKRGVPKVLWLGKVDNGAEHVRALSVNDCAAKVRVSDEGVVLEYADKEVVVPHGGGNLRDVSLDRPAFAERVEIEPLGLAFGKKDEARKALQCTVGWWGKQVVLRSLPEGQYTLRWIGGGREEEAPLSVRASGITGGRLTGTSSISR